MEIVITDRASAAVIAADAVAELLSRKPDAVIGIATGSRPLALYAELAARRTQGRLRGCARLTSFALDEYVGIDVGHPQSYHQVVAREWTAPLALRHDQVHVPSASAETLDTAGPRYETAIRAAGGIDVQIAGIGVNGHVGFNEPGSSLASRTRVKTLSEQTRRDNSRFFDSLKDVPMHCITQGLGTILEGRHILLLAFGAAKARALAGALEGPVTSSRPASVVQLHPHVTVLADEEAAGELAYAAEYRRAWRTRLGGSRLDRLPGGPDDDRR